MTIKRIEIDGLIEHGEFDFTSKTILRSEENQVGKTTLLRAVLYALGFSIPSTRGIKFQDLSFKVKVETGLGDCQIERNGAELTFASQEEVNKYILPDDEIPFHECLFGIKDAVILKNLLGAFYFDQEKGWTLLNRGKVIGSVSFKIEDFLRALSNRSCTTECERLVVVRDQIQKYKKMLSVAQYQATIKDTPAGFKSDTPKQEVVDEIRRIENIILPLSNEVDRIRRVIRDNESFKRYISSMHLVVKSKNGERIPVTEETLDGFKSNERLQMSRVKMLNMEIKRLKDSVTKLRRQANREDLLFEVKTQIEEFDEDIAKIQIDEQSVTRIINALKSEEQSLKSVIDNAMVVGNSALNLMGKCVRDYVVELGLEEKLSASLFTHDLKSLSGAKLHLLVFAFKLAYIRLVRTFCGCCLPIILDSPYGKEVSNKMVEKMFEILARDFSEHQQIIATIFNPTVNGSSLILLKDHFLSLK